MRRLVLLLAAVVLVGWASPVSADDDLEMKGKLFLVKVYDNHYNVVDEGYVFFWRYKPANGAFKNELICVWFGKGVFYNGDWGRELHYDPPYSDFVRWDGWYQNYPSPYDDFTGYYYRPGDFVYGYVEPTDDHVTKLFFMGDRIG